MSLPLSRLELVARLKAALLELHQQSKISPDAYRRESAELDRALVSALGELPEMELPELVERARQAGLLFDLSPLEAELAEAKIRNLRERAVVSGSALLDASSVYRGFSRIPLEPYRWEEVVSRWEELLVSLQLGSLGIDELSGRCRTFFEADLAVSLPARFPEPAPRLIRRLLQQGRLSPADEPSLMRDWSALQRALREERSFLERLLTNAELGSLDPARRSESLFRCLRRGFLSQSRPLDEGLERLVAQWSGPSFSILSVEWWRAARTEPSPRQKRAAHLLLARTGVDPSRDAEWTRWLSAENDREEAARDRWVTAVQRNRDYYDLAFILGAGSAIDEAVPQRWEKILEILRKPEPVAALPRSLPASPLAGRPLARPREPASPPVPAATEDLEAAPAELSREDELVETRSTWSVYLKPFLSENWLGLIGIGSLLAAWLFLSLWLWDKGEVYRVFVGSVPLATLTLGSAYITYFISRQPDASARVTGLFAVLSFLSVPFSFAIGMSVLDAGRGAGFLLGLAQAALLALVLPRVGSWLEPAFGRPPTLFLYLNHYLLYLAPLARWVWGERATAPTLAVMAVAAFLAMVPSIHRAARLGPAFFKFSWVLYAVNFLLANAAARIYYRIPLEASTAALLLQLTSLTLAYFGRTHATAVVTSGALSVLGVLLALNAPPWLPVCLGLATSLWIYQRAKIAADWPNEVLALHLFGFIGSLVYALKVPWSTGHFALLGALGLVWVWERNKRQTRTLDVALLLAPVLSFFASGLEPRALPPWAPAPFLLAVAVLAYPRFALRRKTWFWYLNLALLLLWCYPGTWSLRYRELIHLAAYAGVACLLWPVAAARLQDSTTRIHRGLVLWVLAFGSAALQFALLEIFN